MNKTVIISAAEAKNIADEVNLPAKKMMENIGADIVKAAKSGKYSIDVDEPDLIVITDDYRHVNNELQQKIVENLESFGFSASIVRETIKNERPGPVMARQIIRVKW